MQDSQWTLVAIVDEAKKLLGVVSTGDLRRSILNGHALKTPLAAVMNTDPVVVRFEDFKNYSHISHIVDDLTRRYGRVSKFYAMVPVINRNRKFLGLVSLESLTSFADTSSISLNKRTVLVVGGAGYIGSTLTRLLLDNGWAVRILDKMLYSETSLLGLEGKDFQLMRGDAGNTDDIVNAVSNVDAVVYLAELVGDPACSIAPQVTLKTNYLAVTSMAHLCSHLNINRFVYTSSCSVYGANPNPEILLNEESPLSPVSLYARMKTLVEEAILAVCNMPNRMFSPTILRLSTVFGYSFRPRFDLVVNTFAKNAWAKNQIDVFGGDQWRPNVHVRDVAQAVLCVLNAPQETVRAQVFNVGGAHLNHTINELAEMVQDVFPGTQVNKKEAMIDLRNYRVDFSKIERTLGYRAKISVKDGLREIKDVLDKKELPDLEDARFSNYKRMQELNYR